MDAAIASQTQGATRAEVEAAINAATAAATTGQLSAGEVKGIVDAAVASQAPGATRAEVEAAINAATANQLSAAEVQKIVDASLMSTEEALMATRRRRSLRVAKAAERAQRAAEAAGEPLIKAATKGEFFSYKYDGPRPTTFQEAPMLAELVQQGQLPPSWNAFRWRRTSASSTSLKSGNSAEYTGSPATGSEPRGQPRAVGQA